MSMVAFITKFMTLKYYSKMDNKAAVSLLEDIVHPHIQYQLFTIGWQSENYNATLTAIKEIGSNLEVVMFSPYPCTPMSSPLTHHPSHLPHNPFLSYP